MCNVHKTHYGAVGSINNIEANCKLGKFVVNEPTYIRSWKEHTHIHQNYSHQTQRAKELDWCTANNIKISNEIRYKVVLCNKKKGRHTTARQFL